jgi:hypothetical protein
MMPACLQFAIVNGAKAAGKRRVILRVDGEPTGNLLDLAENRLDECAGGAIGFDEGHKPVGE